ncbi:MAG: hypothetical protein DI538_07650 [Azospira oryzae]|nr:MAG: hypothetical protein DI538_07650 [Azospira oryzae]
MKTIWIVLLLLGISFSERAYAQTQEVQQLLLNLEKLRQLQNILDDMYKGYKILNDGYNLIKNISEGNFKLHQVFLDALYMVNPAVRDYKKIPLIIDYQILLVKEAKRAKDRIVHDADLTVGEITYTLRVYDFLIDASLKNLDELVMLVTASRLRMSDADRLASIDRIYADMERKVSFLRLFNTETFSLSRQHAKERADRQAMEKLHDVVND